MKDKILVTGASGFIGRYCLPLLVSAGYEVHAVRTATVNKSDSNKCIWHSCDLSNFNNVDDLLCRVRPTHLLHLAWTITTGYGVSGEVLNDIDTVWVERGMELLRCFAKYGGQRAVITGTCAEYSWTENICVEDKTPIEPATVYGKAKAAFHQSAMMFAKENNIRLAWGRLFFVYGPDELPQRLVTSTIRSLLEGNVARCEQGELVRDYIHVEDVACALAVLVADEFHGTINIASGKRVPLKHIVTLLGSMVGRSDLVQINTQIDLHQAQSVVADMSKLRDLISWKPKFDIKSGLQHTVDMLMKEEGYS